MIASLNCLRICLRIAKIPSKMHFLISFPSFEIGDRLFRLFFQGLLYLKCNFSRPRVIAKKKDFYTTIIVSITYIVLNNWYSSARKGRQVRYVL